MFTVGCILLPLANQISGPISNGQSNFIDNKGNSSTSVHNITNVTNDDYDYYSGDISDIPLDNNITNDTCHSSRLESSVGGNSIGHIPLRVWLTVCWILGMMIVGR